MTTITANPAKPAVAAKTGRTRASVPRPLLVQISPPELQLALRSVMPHAHRKDDLSSLNAVQFIIRDGTLYLAATDRYTLGLYRCLEGMAGTGDDRTSQGNFSFLVGLADCKLLLADAKQASPLLPMRFSLTRTEADRGHQDVIVVSSDGVIRTLTGETQQAPDVWRVVQTEVERLQRNPGSDYTPVNRSFLGRLSDAQQAGEVAVLHHSGPNKPTLAVIGESFIAVIVPVRSASPALPAWLPGYQAPAAPEEPAVPAPEPVVAGAPVPAPPPATASVTPVAPRAKVASKAKARVTSSGAVRRITPRPAAAAAASDVA